MSWLLMGKISLGKKKIKFGRAKEQSARNVLIVTFPRAKKVLSNLGVQKNQHARMKIKVDVQEKWRHSGLDAHRKDKRGYRKIDVH